MLDLARTARAARARRREPAAGRGARRPRRRPAGRHGGRARRPGGVRRDLLPAVPLQLERARRGRNGALEVRARPAARALRPPRRTRRELHDVSAEHPEIAATLARHLESMNLERRSSAPTPSTLSAEARRHGCGPSATWAAPTRPRRAGRARGRIPRTAFRCCRNCCRHRPTATRDGSTMPSGGSTRWCRRTRRTRRSTSRCRRSTTAGRTGGGDQGREARGRARPAVGRRGARPGVRVPTRWTPRRSSHRLRARAVARPREPQGAAQPRRDHACERRRGEGARALPARRRRRTESGPGADRPRHRRARTEPDGRRRGITEAGGRARRPPAGPALQPRRHGRAARPAGASPRASIAPRSRRTRIRSGRGSTSGCSSGRPAASMRRSRRSSGLRARKPTHSRVLTCWPRRWPGSDAGRTPPGGRRKPCGGARATRGSSNSPHAPDAERSTNAERGVRKLECGRKSEP